MANVTQKGYQQAYSLNAFSKIIPPPIFSSLTPTATDQPKDGRLWVVQTGVAATEAAYIKAQSVSGSAVWLGIGGAVPITPTSITTAGLITGTGGMTLTGATLINTTGTGATTIGSATGGAISLVTGTTFGVTATGAATLAAATWGFTGNTLITGTLGTVGAGITSATFLTATAGDITATNGNILSSTIDKGVKVTPRIMAAGGTPQTCNSRHGKVTFNSVSIAGGATQAFTIANSLITAATQVVMVTMHGATTGAALCLSSIVCFDSSANTIIITVNNGTGATTQVADLTFVFWLLN